MSSKLPLTIYYTSQLNELILKCLARVTYGTRFNINIISQVVKLKKARHPGLNVAMKVALDLSY